VTKFTRYWVLRGGVALVEVCASIKATVDPLAEIHTELHWS
jgi:hypothetical protein